MKIFAYGTLKRDCDTQGIMNKLGARYLGTTRASGLRMYHFTGALFDFPGIVIGEGVVYGELFEVPNGAVSVLDHYEGVPHLFRRDFIHTSWEFDPDDSRDDRRVMAYYYIGKTRDGKRITSGVWPN
jgi:gamma-glutamylcyclotransferase (GGCT)/AIG2-like uncharacterized protein YtfP